jgi:ribonuclease Z
VKKVLGAGAVVLAAALALGCQRLVDAQIERSLTRRDASLLASPDLQVVLCGTGSPLPARERASACLAVIAGGEFALVDVGPGAWKTVDLANLPTASLGAVLLTHFHSDHIGDLGEAITQSWIAGRTRPLDVYGPPGTARVVEGLREAYAFDVGYRVAHHGDAWMPRAAAGATAREIALPQDPLGSTVVFERNGLRVSLFAVDHQPVAPAVGYRFDYRGRSVVVSGDTRPSPSLVANARGADLLVHEALQPDLVARSRDVARRIGLERLAKLADDILGYHTSPVEAAAEAREAGVAHLVFTHLVPSPPNFLVRRQFVAGVADAYAGEVTLGEDGMRFALSPRLDAPSPPPQR